MVKEGHLDPFMEAGSGTSTGITWTSNASSAANYYNAAEVLTNRT